MDDSKDSGVATESHPSQKETETATITTEADIQALLHIVTEGQAGIANKKSDAENLNASFTKVKEEKHDRISQLQKEIAQIDSEQAGKLSQLSSEEQSIDAGIFDAKEKLLRRIILCNVKNTLSNGLVMTSQPREIYRNKFLSIWPEISENDKPVNKITYRIILKVVEGKLVYELKKLCKTIKDLWWNYNDDPATYYDKDFKTVEEAEKYGERNKDKITSEFIKSIKCLEAEIDNANSSIDDVFDFRLITSSTVSRRYSGDRTFDVVSTTKNILTVKSTPNSWDTDGAAEYDITITQKGYNLTIEGHRHQREQDELLDFVKQYFHFIEA